MKRYLWGFLLFLILGPAFAQSDACPTLVEEALKAVGDNCADLGRNFACYGFNHVTATFVDGASATEFNKPSDKAELATLQNIETAPLQPDLNLWGLAVLHVQANVPNSLPGQAVTFLLIGDVHLENAVDPEDVVQPGEPIALTTLAQSNIRNAPNPDATVLISLPRDTALEADAVSPDNQWVRILYEDTPAWVSTQLVNVVGEGRLADLPILTAQSRTPMQSFYFTTGLGATNCNEAPPSALIVQGPEGMKVNLTANGVDILLGSTIVLQTTADNTMQITTIDGAALASSVIVPAGFTVSAPLSEDNQGLSGPLINLRPMTQAELTTFKPLENLQGDFLSYDVSIPTQEDIQLTIQAIAATTGGGGAGVISGPAAENVSCNQLRATSPIGIMPSGNVTFYWDPAKGADYYIVNLYDQGGSLKASAGVGAPQTNVTINVDGVGLGNFSWEVVAVYKGQAACTTARVSLASQQPPPGAIAPGPVTCPSSASC